ncbi:MAG TPA: hypothetical protein VGR57_22005, partial [Ktedonobacterales bacterium]|nr:hypothetical protein [Ktedonobacterales bacterium]
MIGQPPSATPSGTQASHTFPRTIVYIDGFNLYYRRLKGTVYRWLNIEEMCALLLPKNQIERINYYTARIKDPAKYG